MHTASVNWVSINPCNGLSCVRCQAITWTNADLLSIKTLPTWATEYFYRQHSNTCTMVLKTKTKKNKKTCTMVANALAPCNACISSICLGSSGHQQPWYWQCRFNKSLSPTEKDFKHLHMGSFWVRAWPMREGISIIMPPLIGQAHS